ncbi:fimbrial assembly protein [Enterobacter sp. MGH 24]|uniref:fimbrial biogenesis chaperone n=1 Tax=Enterobacter sp. MGH 24 TaxID=1329828 RepID=UPI0003BF80E5|nr:molecular chaperone [Enterobacter sp. MGH 24]ESN17290.1 fimbrial assembly protein [Enterobacter sp. MGH 24]
MKSPVLKSLCLMIVSAAFTTHAAVNLDRTRIVFPQSDKASSLKVDNQSKALPYLALSWIEDENGRKEDSHFMALPPIQRIEAGSASQIRIVKQAATSQLPPDRESLFYFNLREVPPKSTSASDEHSVMQVAMQSRIKLFWRPKAITKKPGERAEMRMEISATAKGLTVHNPTPYYITLAWLSKNAKTMLPGFDSLMIAPFSTASTSTGDYHGSYYSIGYIDDYGALRKVDVQCAGTAPCTLTERKVDKDAKAH